MQRRMTLPLSRERCSSTAILRSVGTVMAVIIGLALSVTLATLFSLSFPRGSSFIGYFYGLDSSGKLEVQILQRNHRESTLDLTDPLKVNVSLVSDVGIADNSERTAGCDLYDGEWFHDPSGPLYTNNTCPVLTQMQNCRGNGRPDTDYENWRWRPSRCVLPRFDPHLFLRFMSRKTLAFIGDSVARNQMESLLCILWQVEVPKNRGSRRMQRWYFRSTSTTIVRIWSSWLVRHTSEKFGPVPEGVVKLHLDSPDAFIDLMPAFDVAVLSSGHWFAKQSAYLLAGELVGSQLWHPDASLSPAAKVDSVRAFGVSVETVLSSVAAHPNYTGLTIVRSYSPDHYEGGSWNTGGSCTGKTRPLPPDALVPNGFTDAMHAAQADAFRRALRQAPTPASRRLRFMDITRPFSYRHDGHPGPYRTPDPNKVTRRAPDGRPPPQDCLHWCMPGPVDTWNELILEIIRRHFSSHE